MRRSSYRRAATRRGPDRRVIAAAAVLVVAGGVVGITQISNADETKVAACAPAPAETTAGAKAATDPKVGTYTDKDGDVQHKGDGQLAKGQQAPEPEPAGECKDGTSIKKTVNGLEILTDTCDDSDLAPHDGFQNGNRCVSTEFGEVGEAAKNPTLLITESPREVTVGQPFQLKVSTRNLVRDRFLAAGQGGYYVESSVLTAEGLVRGHFHTACRMLQSTSEAVDPAPVPAFFVATEDKRGGAQPDTVTIQVPGLPQAGIAQCASWAGDGSHRVPMMQRANQTPAIDAVRVTVRGAGGEGDGGDQGGDNGGGGGGGGDNGGGDQGGDGDNGGGQEQPTTPPADNGGDGGNQGGDNGQGDGGNQGGDGGNQDGDNGQGDGGDQGDAGDTGGAAPGATATPKTETGTTPPKAPTVTIPPRSGGDEQQDDDAPATPKPAKTTTAPAKDDAGSGADEDADEAGADTPPAQNVAGRTATPKASKSTQAAAANRDDGAPDQPEAQDTTQVADVEAAGANRLALTGANVMAISLGGAVLVLGGLLALSATRRRRAEAGRD